MCVWLTLAFGERLLVTGMMGEKENGKPILAVLSMYIFLLHNHNPKSANTNLGYTFLVCETKGLPWTPSSCILCRLSWFL